MKYLIQHTFSVPNPYYLVPNALNQFWGKKKINELFRFGVGKQDEDLFVDEKFDGTELTGIITGVFKENWDFNKERIEKYKKSKYPIEVFHACTSGTKMRPRLKDDWNLNLAKDDDSTRRGIAASIFLAKELIKENPICNFHLGKFPPENYDVARNSVLKNLTYASKIAKEEQVIITIENDYSKYVEEDVFGDDATEMLEILKEINSDFVGVCFDWGHANVQARNEFDKKRISLEELHSFHFLENFIETLGEKIYYAHLHYNLAHCENLEVKTRSIVEPDNRDLHMPINKVHEDDKENYIETLKLLKNKTSINKCGKIMLELTRDKMFGFVPFNKFGANTQDALESLDIVKEVFSS